MDGNDMSYNTWVQQCQQTEGFGRITVKDRMWISDIVCQVYLFPSDWDRTQEVPQTVSPPLMLPFHPNWLASFGLVSLQMQRPLNFNVLDNMIDKVWQDVIVVSYWKSNMRRWWKTLAHSKWTGTAFSQKFDVLCWKWVTSSICGGMESTGHWSSLVSIPLLLTTDPRRRSGHTSAHGDMDI